MKCCARAAVHTSSACASTAPQHAALFLVPMLNQTGASWQMLRSCSNKQHALSLDKHSFWPHNTPAVRFPFDYMLQNAQLKASVVQLPIAGGDSLPDQSGAGPVKKQERAVQAAASECLA